mmetsp:Transcript_20389/g.61140  ORF Transcript_20389/g.61140 Transcript_20389/m.61140 type:complete len:415 (+) Transcript_20389:38-1282(+)
MEFLGIRSSRESPASPPLNSQHGWNSYSSTVRDNESPLYMHERPTGFSTDDRHTLLPAQHVVLWHVYSAHAISRSQAARDALALARGPSLPSRSSAPCNAKWEVAAGGRAFLCELLHRRRAQCLLNHSAKAGPGRRALTQRLDGEYVLDLCRLHVRVGKQQQARLCTVHAHNIVGGEHTRRPNVEEEVPLVEGRLAELIFALRPLPRLDRKRRDGIQQLVNLARLRCGGHHQLNEQRQLAGARQVGQRHVLDGAVAHHHRLAVGGEKVRAQHLDILDNQRGQRGARAGRCNVDALADVVWPRDVCEEEAGEDLGTHTSREGEEDEESRCEGDEHAHKVDIDEGEPQQQHEATRTCRPRSRIFCSRSKLSTEAVSSRCSLYERSTTLQNWSLSTSCPYGKRSAASFGGGGRRSPW